MYLICTTDKILLEPTHEGQFKFTLGNIKDKDHFKKPCEPFLST